MPAIRGPENTGRDRSRPSPHVVLSLAIEHLQLLEELDAGIVVTDAAGIVVRWNCHAERILGLTADLAIGRPWTAILSVIRGEDIAADRVRAAAMQPGGWHGRTQLRIGDDHSVWVQAHVQALVVSPADEQPGIAAIFWLDPQPNLDDGEDDPACLPYHDLLNSSTEALFLIDLQGTIVEASGPGAAVFGASPAEVVGRSLTSHIPGWTDAARRSAFSEIVRAGSIVREAVIARASGEPRPVELIATLVSPVDAGLALVRLHDLAEVRQFSSVLKSLTDLAGLARSTWDVEAVAARALEIVSVVWRADISIVAVASTGTVRYEVGTGASDTARTRLAAIATSEAGLAGQLPKIDSPLDVDLVREGVETGLAEQVRAYGCKSLRATPLWFGDRRVGTLLLFWTGPAPTSLDSHELELVARLIGIAIGNTELRGEMRRETELRTSLEAPARLGTIAVNQMTDGIVTTDANRVVTTVNPAAERLYGFRAE